MADPSRIMIIAGEASGDLHGGALASALLKIDPTLSLVGIGGPAMRQAGVAVKFDIADLGIVGLFEVLLKWRSIFRAYQTAKKLLRDQVSLLVIIDFPDFNLQVAKVAKQMGIPVVYYIGPQLWAWRASRINIIRERIDLMLVIFPFEVDLYRKANVPVEYVGHPLWDEAAPCLEKTISKSDYLTGKGLNPDRITLGLLPGSRVTEIERHLPVMLEGIEQLEGEIGPIQILIPVASTISIALIEKQIAHSELPIRLVQGEIYDLLRATDAVVVASGTATLQVALAQTPMVIIYKLSAMTYALVRRWMKIRWIGLVNIVAQTDLVPELIQGDATPTRISQAVRQILGDQAAYQKMRIDLAEVGARLSSIRGAASSRAAESIYQLLCQSVKK